MGKINNFPYHMACEYSDTTTAEALKCVVAGSFKVNCKNSEMIDFNLFHKAELENLC